MRHRFGRFVLGLGGSSVLRPLHGSRHRAAQMKFFSGQDRGGRSRRGGVTSGFGFGSGSDPKFY